LRSALLHHPPRAAGTLAGHGLSSHQIELGERHGTRNFTLATRCAHPDHHYPLADIPSLISQRPLSLKGLIRLAVSRH
jgi:hypothetical protein